MSSLLVSSSQLSGISFGLLLLFFPGSRFSNAVLTKKTSLVKTGAERLMELGLLLSDNQKRF